jgi:2-polyprenyl-3-methyl-5-hydroxy-6-metoxy-1,4-benzoquinol methylase
MWTQPGIPRGPTGSAGRGSAGAGPEDADVETASEDYARRFSGSVGRWFLDLQADTTLDLLRDLPGGASVLDVGGGHAQLTGALLGAGYSVLVAGSDASCAARLAPWRENRRLRFEAVDLGALPYSDQAFDAVLCFRLLPHSVAWTRLVREVCRVARLAVVVDYPSSRSVNIIADRLFRLKRRIERNTRPYTVFQRSEVRAAFAEQGFEVRRERPQFLLPLVLNRWLGRAALARALELPGQFTGLRRILGSPVIVRADRLRTPGQV